MREYVAMPNPDDLPFLVQVALEEELWDQLQARALVEEVTVEDILRRALTQYLINKPQSDPQVES